MAEEHALFHAGELVAGAYEIRSVLGEGGMGRVYGAHDVALNRRVALKASWPEIDAALLQQEAQALASVRHPGMIEVYSTGVHRGIPFLVMEHLYGVDLASFLETRFASASPLSVTETLDVLIPVADALGAVHRSGIVHRDVKPGNIMLTPSGRVVLMDFGLFRPENESKVAPSGTPEYMAPESLQGNLDPRDAFFLDVYALGITAYEMLAGEVPFLGESPEEIVARHAELEARDLRQLRADVPQRLAALVHEMIAKDPLDRPPSMDAVSFRLRAARDALTAPRAPAAKFTVLVVDDDAALGKLLGLYATRAVPEAVVVTVDAAEKALAAVGERAPDVMLLDLHMPKMNGIELCMMLRGMHLADQCAIIAVSAGARDADLELLRQLGIARFVPKGGDLGARLGAQLKELYGVWRKGKGSESLVAPATSTSMKVAAPVATRAPVIRSSAPPPSSPALSAFALLRTLARTLDGVNVVVFDRDMRLVFLCEARAESRGAIEEVLAPDRAVRLRPLYEAALRGQTDEMTVEAGERVLRARVVPVHNEAGQVVAGMAVVVDEGVA